MRHPTEIQIAFTTPTRPVVLRNGEKANERSVGAVVLLIREQMPKIAPRIARRMDQKNRPMITRDVYSCRLNNRQLNHPQRRVRQHDDNRCHKCNTDHPTCVVFLCLHYSIPPCYHSCLMQDTIQLRRYYSIAFFPINKYYFTYNPCICRLSSLQDK